MWCVTRMDTSRQEMAPTDFVDGRCDGAECDSHGEPVEHRPLVRIEYLGLWGLRACAGEVHVRERFTVGLCPIEVFGTVFLLSNYLISACVRISFVPCCRVALNRPGRFWVKFLVHQNPSQTGPLGVAY